MKRYLSICLFISFFSSLQSQIHDNGIGGYGYVDYNLMHNSKIQGNWIYGGGGLIVNKVYFAGLYYGSQINAFNNYDFENDKLLITTKNSTDSLGSLFNLTLSDIGGQFGAVIFAEKPLQIVISTRAGVFLSNLNETIAIGREKAKVSTKPFVSFSPDIKIAFMPTRICKFQVGGGYKFVYYADGRLNETGEIGNRNTMFNSWYWTFSLVFGSF